MNLFILLKIRSIYYIIKYDFIYIHLCLLMELLPVVVAIVKQCIIIQRYNKMFNSFNVGVFIDITDSTVLQYKSHNSA